MNLPKFVRKSKRKQRCYHLRSYRDIDGNNKEMRSLFLAINTKDRRFRKSKGRRHNNERQIIYLEKERIITKELKTTSPE